MSGFNRHIGFRLRLFDDTGMTRQMRSNLYWVIWAVTAGILGTVVTTGPVWSAFQREVLGANDFQLGLIAAIPYAASVLQILFSYIIERKRNRRFLFLFCGLLGRSFWIIIGLAPYLFPSFSVDLRIWLVIVFVIMVYGGNSCVNLGFGSLMGDLVPMRIRGSYFSVRQMVSLASGVISGLLISMLIDRVGLVGYTIALVLAGVTQMADVACYIMIDWPPMAVKEGDTTSFPTMVGEVFANKRFLKIVVSYSIWLFAVNIAGPFWNVYMLEDLKMNFTQMSLYTQIISNVTTVLIISRWGRLIDHYGNKPVLQMVALLVTLSPIPWFFAKPATTGFVLLSNIISGASWPVSDVCQQNLYLERSPEVHRSMYIAVFLACINLFGIALSNAVGGWLMQVPFSALAQRHYVLLGMTLTRTHYLFLTTIFLRLFVTLVFLPRIAEDGDWTLRATVKDIAQTTRNSILKSMFLFRVKILRRRERRRLDREEQKKAREE